MCHYCKPRRPSLADLRPDSLAFLPAAADCLAPVRHTSQIIREILPSRRRNNLRICYRKTPEFNNGALAPFLRLDDPLAIALDGAQFQCSDALHCELCSTRHVGKEKTLQYFHSMLAATVVADGRNRAISLMPHFVQPQHNPHD